MKDFSAITHKTKHNHHSVENVGEGKNDGTNTYTDLYCGFIFLVSTPLFTYSMASLVTQMVKNPPAVRETWV